MGYELSMLPKERMLLYLGFKIGYRVFNPIEYRSFKCYILNYVHLYTHSFLYTFIANEASTPTRKKLLRIFTKQQNTSHTNLLLSLCIGSYEAIIFL